MGNLGLQELLVLALVALVFVGPKRLPELGRAVGEAVRAFQRALRADDRDDKTP
jgi:sec-independent protein translocase protein TatA